MLLSGEPLQKQALLQGRWWGRECNPPGGTPSLTTAQGESCSGRCLHLRKKNLTGPTWRFSPLLIFQPMCLREKGLVTVTSGLASCCSFKNSQSRNLPVRALQFVEDWPPWDQLLLLWSSPSCRLFTFVFLDPICPSVSIPISALLPSVFFFCVIFCPWFISN